MWPLRKTTRLKRAAQRYELACMALSSDSVHPYHIALHSITWGLREVIDSPPNEAWNTDPVAYLAFRQAMWYDCVMLIARKRFSGFPYVARRVSEIAYVAIRVAGLVLYQDITGKATSSLEVRKYLKLFKQALDVFPTLREAPDGVTALASLSTACGYPPDPIIMTHLGRSHAAFQKYTAPALESLPLGLTDPSLRSIHFETWLELVGARDRR